MTLGRFFYMAATKPTTFEDWLRSEARVSLWYLWMHRRTKLTDDTWPIVCVY